MTWCCYLMIQCWPRSTTLQYIVILGHNELNESSFSCTWVPVEAWNETHMSTVLICWFVYHMNVWVLKYSVMLEINACLSFLSDQHDRWYVHSVLLTLDYSGIILCMGSVSERQRYIVTSSLIGWAHTQNDPAIFVKGLKYSGWTGSSTWLFISWSNIDPDLIYCQQHQLLWLTSHDYTLFSGIPCKNIDVLMRKKFDLIWFVPWIVLFVDCNFWRNVTIFRVMTWR